MIKSYFFYFIIGLIGFSIIGFFLFHLGKGLLGMFSDWRLHKELDTLESEGESRRQAKVESDAKRLDNGCSHDFEGGLGGFPPDVCPKCGLAKDKPNGPCDHVWRRAEGAIPHSVCEKCGKKYNAVTEHGSLT